MDVRREGEADHDHIARLLTEAFAGPAEARLVDLLRASPAYVPELALVAEVDGVVAGHVLFTVVAVGEIPALALAPMAVRPTHQRTGIGSALVRAGLERAEARPEAAVIVLGHPDYYPRFGFQRARAFGIEPPWPDIPDEAFLVRPLPAYTEACRGVVVYPPAVDEV